MPTPSTLNEDIDSLFATTLRNYRDQLADNIFQNNSLLTWLQNNGGIREDTNGGNRIEYALMYGENSTVGSYSGYDTIDTSAQDNIGAAWYEWKQIAGTVSISGREQKQNKNRSQIMNLLDKKTQNLEMSLSEELNDQILNRFSSGNGGKDLVPLPLQIAKDPTSSSWNPVGNIDGSSSDNDFWRNQAEDGSGISDRDDLKDELFHMYHLCSQGTGGRPDLVITDLDTYENYVMAMDNQIRYRQDDTADFGFDAVQLRNASVVWEESMPDVQNETASEDATSPSTGTAFFLNTDFIELVVEGDTNFVPTEFKEPANQDAQVAQVLWMGALGVNNRRKHGVLYNIPQSL